MSDAYLNSHGFGETDGPTATNGANGVNGIHGFSQDAQTLRVPDIDTDQESHHDHEPIGSTSQRKRKCKWTIKEAAIKIIKSQKTIALWKVKSHKNMCGACTTLQIDVDKFIIRDHSSDQSRHAYKLILPVSEDPNYKHSPIGAGSGKYRLGTLEEIKTRSERCPLCSLVVASVNDFEYPEMTLDEWKVAICYASWQVDGREVERDCFGRVISSRPRTRRIQLHWDNDLIDDSHLVLRAREVSMKQDSERLKSIATATKFLGRNMTSAGNNTTLVKSWLALCQEEHGSLCQTQRDPSFDVMVSQPYFGVVDVHSMRLTSLPPGARYLALSYVWGEGERHTTKLANVEIHQRYGGLESVFPKLPQAIQDAIQLVRSLGERYIWIDSLCIVQDSDNSWNLNALAMDLVYGNAHLTICAADGEGIKVGLRALKPAERTIVQHTERCSDNLVLMVSHLAEDYIKRSRWNTRGWTFQERLLSKRCLIFAGGRVYFQCRSVALSEDITAEQGNAGWSIELVQAPLQMLHELSTRPIWVYMECVRLYSARTLGRSGDILAAFTGMSNLIEHKMGAPLVFGLPSSHFDLALLWQPNKASQSRKAREEITGTRTRFAATDFPSWSWCGWTATAEYQRDMLAGCLSNVHAWLRDRTWIQWHIRDGYGHLRPLWHYSSREKYDPHMEARWSGYGSTADQENPYSRSARVSPESDRGIFSHTLPEYPFCVSIADLNSAGSREFPDQRYLQFSTWSAFLRIIPHAQSSKLGEGLARYDIADYTGDWCGSIVLEREWADKNVNREQEFIAISEALNFSEDENDLWTYYISKEKDTSEWDLFYVLLIESKKGISQRRGLGKVFKESFMNCCIRERKWQEIILE